MSATAADRAAMKRAAFDIVGFHPYEQESPEMPGWCMCGLPRRNFRHGELHVRVMAYKDGLSTDGILIKEFLFDEALFAEEGT